MFKWTPLILFFMLCSSPLFAEENYSTSINFWEVFQASPTIYIILFSLSLFAFTLWLYSLMTLSTEKLLPECFVDEIESNLKRKNFDLALKNCEEASFLGAELLLQGLLQKNLGKNAVSEAMSKEGKRMGIKLWQRLSLLNDIVVIAPMLGLLGTVIGMFYAFYDVNRSIDSLTAIFDGLGIAVGTTVAGLIVALLSLMMHATLKYRIIRTLNSVEKISSLIIRYID